MSVARTRAFTHYFRCYFFHFFSVEMSVARTRAFTRSILFIRHFSVPVEMSVARTRAFTHSDSTAHNHVTHGRNECCPYEGIYTCYYYTD